MGKEKAQPKRLIAQDSKTVSINNQKTIEQIKNITSPPPSNQNSSQNTGKETK